MSVDENGAFIPEYEFNQSFRVLLTPLTCVHAGNVFPGENKEQTTSIYRLKNAIEFPILYEWLSIEHQAL